VVFTNWPATVPVTVTVNMHCPFALMEEPDIVIVRGEIGRAARRQRVADAVGAVSPAGSVFVNPTPVRPSAALELAIVNCRPVVAWRTMDGGKNVVAMLGGDGVVTVRFADALLPIPPLLDVTLPVVFVYWPADAPVTVTVNTHCPFALMEEPDIVIVRG